MPILEFRCAACQCTFEHLVLHSSPEPHCPKCQGQDLQRVVSLAAVSSDHTQQRSLRGAKKRVETQRYDRAYEDHKDYHKHLDD